MKKLIFPLFISLVACFYSCKDEKTVYALDFKHSPSKAVADSLIKLEAIFKKLDPMRSNPSVDSLSTERNEPGLISLLYDGTNLSYNLKNEIIWKDFENNFRSFQNLIWLHPLSASEKRELWILIKFSIDNEINGLECCSGKDQRTTFIFRGYPFENKHDMIILFEDQFDQLSKHDKQAFLRSQLIIDRKEGLLLLVQNKGRFLRYVFGSDDKVPKHWLTPTERVFRFEEI